MSTADHRRDREQGQHGVEPHLHPQAGGRDFRPQDQLGDADQQIGEDDDRAGGVQQEQEDGLRRHVGGDDAEIADQGRGQDRRYRDAAPVGVEEHGRALRRARPARTASGTTCRERSSGRTAPRSGRPRSSRSPPIRCPSARMRRRREMPRAPASSTAGSPPAGRSSRYRRSGCGQ